MKRRNAVKVWLILAAVLITAAVVLGLTVFRGEPEKPAAELPLAGKRVFLAGDSRSSTDYTFYGELLEQKSGCTALVMGASGRNAAYNASDEYLALLRDTPHDFSIWLVGGNDTGEAGTVGTFRADSALAKSGEPVVAETDISGDYTGTTFIQAVDHMMRKYKAMAQDAGIPESEISGRMIFCTDLPQQRDSADSPWSDPQNWERKREAILECCEKNGVTCLDLYRLCAFDMQKEPMYTEPTDTVNDRGVYYMDGLHPNRRGMDKVTDLEINVMKQWIK